MRAIKIVPQTSRAIPDGWLGHADDALTQGLTHVASAWSSVVWTITDDLAAQGYQMVLVDDLPEAPGALAYHDIDAQGHPILRVGLNAIFQGGGDWYSGNLSVVSVLDHETKEVVGDPACNLWCNDAQGVNWAREFCDFTQTDVYEVTCADGTTATLSNFALPGYFSPAVPPGTKLDWMGLAATPFEIRPGGYAIRQEAGKITQVTARKQGPVIRPPSMRHRALERAAWFPGAHVTHEWDRPVDLDGRGYPTDLSIGTG